MNNSRSIVFVLFLFVISLLAAYSIYSPFLLPIVVAALMVMATYNLTEFFIKKFNSNKIATFIMTVLLVLLILAPIVYAATSGVAMVSKMDTDSIKTIIAKAKELVKDIPYLNSWANEYLRSEKILPYFKDISLYVTKAGSLGLGFLRDAVLVIIFYAVINYYRDRFFAMIKALIPVSDKKSGEMLSEISSTMEVVFYSIVLTAVFEGMLFGFFISYFGFDGLLFGMLYGFASLVPVVGGALLWVPLSLYAWSEMGSSSAIVIVLYSVIVISVIADTFIKPIIIKIIKEDLLGNDTNINELIIFFSILAGMTSYGFWGAIIGPAITTFLFSMSKIYIEYNQMVRENDKD